VNRSVHDLFFGRRGSVELGHDAPPARQQDAVRDAQHLRQVGADHAGRADAGCGSVAGAALKKMVGPAAKRAAVAHLQARMGLSERRACSIVGADRAMIRYRSRRPADTELRARLRELANERRRFGYRRLFVLLRRQGEPSGINRIHRLYREDGLAVRKRRVRRRKACGVRAPIPVEAMAERALVSVNPNAKRSLSSPKMRPCVSGIEIPNDLRNARNAHVWARCRGARR
jgi:hypothetical protein